MGAMEIREYYVACIDRGFGQLSKITDHGLYAITGSYSVIIDYDWDFRVVDSQSGYIVCVIYPFHLFTSCTILYYSTDSR